MRQFISAWAFLLALTPVSAQSVAINTDGSSAHSSSILEVKSTTKGMLIPRMTTVQRNAIAAPATGLLIYNTDVNVFQFRNGASWVNLNSEKILSDADGDTKIQVEEGANDNLIRFDISGDERMVLRENPTGNPRLELSDNTLNTFIGSNSGRVNTTGFENIALGQNTLYSNTTGEHNSAVGTYSLFSNTTGNYNTTVGGASMKNNTTGYFNSALGNGALGENTEGNFNVAVGSVSLLYNTTGNRNTGVGFQVLYNNNSASDNTALGNMAGFNFTLGNGNTLLGSQVQANADGYTNSTAIGYNATITASNQVRIGDAGVTSIGGFQNWTNVSDARLKNEVKADVPGLDFINRLRPVTYTLDLNKIRQTLGRAPEIANTTTRTAGFLAQEVEAAAKASHFEFSGVDAPKNEQDFYGLRYAEFTVPLVKAVQELDAENKQLKLALMELTKRLEVLEAAK